MRPARTATPTAAPAASTGSGTGSDRGSDRDRGGGRATADRSGGDDATADRGAGAAAKVRAWFCDRVPAGWFVGAPDVQVDREEITVVGTLADPAGDTEAERAAAAAAQIRSFREETRSRRIEVAREAELPSAARSPGGSAAATSPRCSPRCRFRS